MAIGVIVAQVTMIHSANRIHNSSLLPLYKILRAEYYDWKKKIDTVWTKMRREMSTSSAERFERMLKFQLAFNENEGVERMMMKEKSIREHLELPNLPDYTEMERGKGVDPFFPLHLLKMNYTPTGIFVSVLHLWSQWTLRWDSPVVLILVLALDAGQSKVQ